MRTLRLATYNVHGCVGVDRRRDPARIAAVLQQIDADVVALQEFTYPADVLLEMRSPVVLESLDRYGFALGPTRARGANAFGNVLLSRHPIRALERIDLSHGRREPRGALAATLDVDGTALHVVATHLGLRLGERRFQVQRLLAHLAARRAPLVAVLGDFNDWLPGRSVAHELDRVLGRAARRPSFPSLLPFLPLDRIWVAPGAAVRAVRVHRSRLARLASDHLPVVADVLVPAPREDPQRSGE